MSIELPPARVRRKTLALFRALAHEDRLRVLLALARTEELSVGALTTLCKTSQSAMSHQLKALRDAKLVRAERRGRQVMYALLDRHVARILEDAVEHVGE